MSQFWQPPWEVLEANLAVDIALEHQDESYQLAGEPFYVLLHRWDMERVVRMVGRWERDPDIIPSESRPVSAVRTEIWRGGVDPQDEFPDRDTVEATLYLTEGPLELRRIVTKDHFRAGIAEFALDYRMRRVTGANEPLTDLVWIVVPVPPHEGSAPVQVRYRPITPSIDFAARQPIRDDELGFETSLRGYRQWLDAARDFRGVPMPHTVAVGVPNEPRQLAITRDGVARTSEIDFALSPPPFAPALSVGDILVRAANNARYEVVRLRYDWGLPPAHEGPGSAGLRLQSRLKAQVVSVVLLDGTDPRNRIEIDTTA